MGGLTTRCGTKVQAFHRFADKVPDGLLQEHGGGFLHIIGSGMKQRVEGERQAFGQIITCFAPADLRC